MISEFDSSLRLLSHKYCRHWRCFWLILSSVKSDCKCIFTSCNYYYLAAITLSVQWNHDFSTLHGNENWFEKSLVKWLCLPECKANHREMTFVLCYREVQGLEFTLLTCIYYMLQQGIGWRFQCISLYCGLSDVYSDQHINIALYSKCVPCGYWFK